MSAGSEKVMNVAHAIARIVVMLLAGARRGRWDGLDGSNRWPRFVALIFAGACLILPGLKAEDAGEFAKRLGSPRGLCVVVSEDPHAAFALALAKASELTLVIATPSAEAAAAVRAAAEKAGYLGARVF